MAKDPNQAIYIRIDQVLDANKRSQTLIFSLSVGIFILGIVLVIVGAFLGKPWIVAPSILIEALLYWPINQIIKIRRQNIALAAAPALIATLPPEQAAGEMIKLLEMVKNGK
jgi:hypothetical protein